jgi:hypothetical protein
VFSANFHAFTFPEEHRPQFDFGSKVLELGRPGDFASIEFPNIKFDGMSDLELFRLDLVVSLFEGGILPALLRGVMFESEESFEELVFC